MTVWKIIISIALAILTNSLKSITLTEIKDSASEGSKEEEVKDAPSCQVPYMPKLPDQAYCGILEPQKQHIAQVFANIIEAQVSCSKLYNSIKWER